MNTGLIIRKLRKSQQLSQLELADHLEVSRVYVSQIENEKSKGSLDFLRNVSTFFKVPLPLLLAWEEDAGSDSEIHKTLQELFGKILDAKLQLN